jgi:PAS domain S-box-containing protein
MEIGTLNNNLFSFLKGGGEMGRLISGYPWNKTSAGRAEDWSPYLKSALSILTHSKFPMLLLWGNEHICFYNDPFKDAPGAERKHPWALGRSGAEVWSDRWDRLKPLIDGAMAGNNLPLQTDESFPLFSDRDGHAPCKYSLGQVYDDVGEVRGVFITCHQTEALPVHSEQAEAKASLAIDAANLGTFELNLITNELVTSERFNSIWGVNRPVTRDEFISRIHPDDLPIREKAHEEGRKTGRIQYELRIRHDDKSEHWIRVDGSALYDPAGRQYLMLGVVQDITESKMFTAELARQVQERTEKLQELNEELVATNEELSQANVNLVNANCELEQYAYVASHDLQEPLRKIQTFANILSDRYSGELSQEATTYLSKISASSIRMSTLIKDLLDYSRLTHNRPLFQAVNLNSIVENVLNDFEFVMKQKNAMVEVEELPTIEAIPVQMNQLFYNLIGNSLKFIRKGVQPMIKINAQKLSLEEKRDYGLVKPSRDYVKITVSDNGIGFSQQYAEQIFTIFQRLNDRSIYGGYGIGLALCRRIVVNHNGLISASGRQNEGASFSFVLPEKHQ